MFKLIRLGKVDSTNTFALDNFVDGNVYMSTEQSNGEGRNGNKWLENKGSVAISFCIENNDAFKDGMLTQTLALALCNVIDGALIKWPNDVILNDKKLAGILGRRSGPRLVLGIGVNLNNEAFDKSIENKATSLRLESGKETDVLEFVIKLVREFSKILSKNNFEHINFKQWLKGKDVTTHEETFKFQGVDRLGHALLMNDKGDVKAMMPSDLTLKDTYKHK